MKKILVILMVLVSLVSCGILEDHSEWFNKHKNSNKVKSKEWEYVYKNDEKFDSLLEERNPKVTGARQLAEIYKAWMTLMFLDEPEDIDILKNKLHFKFIDDEILIFEFDTNMHYSGYINTKTHEIYLYNPIYDNHTQQNAVSYEKLVNEINRQLKGNQMIKDMILGKDRNDDFKK